MTLRTCLTNTITATQRQSTYWIPQPLRDLFRRLTVGDRATAQLLRGLLWKYRLFVGLALIANIASAIFEGIGTQINFVGRVVVPVQCG